MNDSAKQIEIKIGKSDPFSTARHVIASIDSAVCINCGRCRRTCPTEAISEYQRPICRLCPDCAEGPEMFPSQIKSFAVEHSCSIGCPLGTVPEGYINLIKEGSFNDAYILISELNPFPSTCAHVCHHPCEAECKRGLLMDLHKPLAIRALKRFITDRVDPYRPVFNRKYDMRVAIVGAGPAGMTAAFDLAKKGYAVKVYEAAPKPGGMARKCIPDFRLNKDSLLAEIDALEKAGVEIIYNAKIGKNPTVAQLKAENDAVLIAVGASMGIKLPLEGLDGNPDRVYDAVMFMERINRGAPAWTNGQKPIRKDVDINVGKNVIVIGGGSVAIDSARTLVRLGVDKVTCICLESEADMPAPISEVDEARDEGIEFIYSASPKRVNCDGAWVSVKSVDFSTVSRIERDVYGRIKPALVEGKDFTVDCDSIIFAIGQKPDVIQIADNANLEIVNGRIKFDNDTLMTSVEGVFVAGDVIEARGSIIEAMASGRKAALSIDNMLQGRELAYHTTHELKVGPQAEWIYRIHLEDAAPQQIHKLRYRDTFEEVELGLDVKTAVEESKRCMKCGYEKVDSERCLGCGVCASICPQQAITLANPSKEV